MMTKLEIKKILNNRKNRLLIIAAFLGAIVFSIFAIDSFRFVDVNDNIKKGISSPRLLIDEKNKWRGEITSDTLFKIVKSYKNGEWQSTDDIIFRASKMLKGNARPMNGDTKNKTNDKPIARLELLKTVAINMDTAPDSRQATYPDKIIIMYNPLILTTYIEKGLYTWYKVDAPLVPITPKHIIDNKLMPIQ